MKMKEYVKPQMRVVQLKTHHHLLVMSEGERSESNAHGSGDEVDASYGL